MVLTRLTRITVAAILGALLVHRTESGASAQALFEGRNGLGSIAELQPLAAFESDEALTLPLPDSPAKAVRSFGHLPLSFERNAGQAGAETKFLVRGRGFQLFLAQTDAVMVLVAKGNDGAERLGLRQPSLIFAPENGA